MNIDQIILEECQKEVWKKYKPTKKGGWIKSFQNKSAKKNYVEITKYIQELLELSYKDNIEIRNILLNQFGVGISQDEVDIIVKNLNNL